VRESSSPVAIAQGVDARHIGAELIIHLDVTALIHGDACVLQTEVIRVRYAAHCEKRMRPGDCPIAAAAIDTDRYLVTAFF
jgi:hypothetical protein